MSQTSFNEIEHLFEAMRLLPKEKRNTYLKSQTASKSTINEVLRLLQANDRLADFLTEPLPFADEMRMTCPDLTGRRVNVWQISCLIGQGGMGKVYLAQRADGEYQQSVAFKITISYLSKQFVTNRLIPICLSL
jgi:hypothetical protein